MADAIKTNIGPGYQIETQTIGPGGDFTNLTSSILNIRSKQNKTPQSDPSHQFVHAFGGKALALAVSKNRPIFYTPDDSPHQSTQRWLRAAGGYRRIETVCHSAVLHRAFIEAGIDVKHCHVIRPGLDFARIRRRRDSLLRNALGFAETDRVILLTGESVKASGHRAALWAAALLNAVDPKYRVLIWGPGDQTDYLVQFAKRQDRPNMLRIAQRELKRECEFEDLLPAADLILSTPLSPTAIMPVSISMAAALPIVATASYHTGELLEDRHTALLSRDNPRAIAQRILDLERDPNIQWSISDMARTEAFEYFTMSRFLNQFRTIYLQMADGQPIQVPAERPGVGARFSGK